jgi:hypothetical protein
MGTCKSIIPAMPRMMNQPDYNKLRRADAAALIDYQKEQYDRGYIDAQIFDGSKTGYSPSIGIFNDYNRGRRNQSGRA